MSSSAGPSRVSRPRKSSAATSNGSTASSIGIADGARTGASGVISISGDWDVMALYLGSEVGNRKGYILSSSLRKQGPITTGLHCSEKCLPPREYERSRGMGSCVRRDDKALRH